MQPEHYTIIIKNHSLNWADPKQGNHLITNPDCALPHGHAQPAEEDCVAGEALLWDERQLIQ